MYEAHFRLREQPFTLTPNTQFYLNSKSHQEASNVLSLALNNVEGFIKIVGEVGTGKTMLCRKLLNSLSDKFVSAYIPNPFLTPDGLRCALADELGINSKTFQSRHQLLKSISQRLIELASANKQAVLIIDEAQSMPVETLEALRLITNLETEQRKLLQVILFGQPELDRMLAQPQLRQLRQRIVFSYSLQPLDREGVENYIQHRVAMAGRNGSPIFTRRAISQIYKSSGGVPRLINILCHKSLLSAFGKGAKQVDKAHVQAAIQDTEGLVTRRFGGFMKWRVAALVMIGLQGINQLLAKGPLQP